LVKRCGLLVDSAATVATAMEKLAAPPRVMRLDMRLPDGKETEVLRYLRVNELPVKVGMVTGSGVSEDLEEL
jgi:CheY-like chemotaxis protein